MSGDAPDLALWTDWLTLAAIPHVGSRRLWELVTALGSPGAVLRAPAARLRSVDGVDEVTAASIVEHRDALDLRAEARALADMGARLLSFLDDAYPRPLRHIEDPPPLLFVLGTLTPMDEIAVAVVGSRNMTSYGRQMAESIAGDLAEAGVTVISGFATGVDGVAHMAALERGGRSIGVLGCGLDVIYPATHRRLRERLVASGALVTTHRLGTAPRAEHFPDRNAILAGMAQAVVVIEASDKSGALLTAHHAVEQGRPVYAVPGDVTRVNSSGVNNLIREGAKLVTSAADVLDDLRGVLRGLLADLGGEATLGWDGEAPDGSPAVQEALRSLSREELELFTAIQAGPVHYDTLLRTVALAPEARAQLPMRLMTLQMQGLIEELPGKRFAARPCAASAGMTGRGSELRASAQESPS